MPSRPIFPDPKPSSSSSSSSWSWSSIHNHHPSTNKAFLLPVTFSATALILVVTVIYLLYHLWHTLHDQFQHSRTRTNPFDSGSAAAAAAPLRLQRFTFKELKSATNGFSPDNLIGKGASGVVFRGILRDGKSVAIKRFHVSSSSSSSSSLQQGAADREFQNELTILGGIIESPYAVALLGYCVEKKQKQKQKQKQRLLIYEYMPNRSLQELLFADGNGISSNHQHCNLSWDTRFQIIQDVAKAIQFLHHGCDPPVIHGDVKPSNVLLDWDFRAKVSDFGLSRHKPQAQAQAQAQAQLGQLRMEIFSQDLAAPELLSVAGTTPRNELADFTHAALQPSTSSSKNSRVFHDCNGLNPPLNHDLETNEDGSSPSPISGNVKQWGKEWWWRQEGSGELCSKDYVSEWIGTQICQPNLPDWEEEEDDEIMTTTSPNSDKMKGANSFSIQVPQSGYVLDDDEGLEQRKGNIAGNSRSMKIQEWWKEEHLDEIMSRKGTTKKSLDSRFKKQKRFKKFFRLAQHVHLRCCQSHIFKPRIKLIVGDPDAELSFRRARKRSSNNNNNGHFMGSSELWSGDLFSRELSSTTSMRGTLCYVAPEYGGSCGCLMEKADIYSLGVLIIVIISGRRPLHVLNSPMKLEKANLINWCRQLAQAGNVLELVDERMKDAYHKEQATLCINVALACLQRIPQLRPDIVDVVKILQGEKDLPPLPFELSPSPPSKLLSRSIRKHKSNPKS
ncbi:hypothetical protein Dimus_027888 [Dionaea muscipula]